MLAHFLGAVGAPMGANEHFLGAVGASVGANEDSGRSILWIQKVDEEAGDDPSGGILAGAFVTGYDPSDPR